MESASLAFFGSTQRTYTARTLSRRADAVVLVHGLFAGGRSMRKLERRLVAAGFQVFNWTYPTLWSRTTNIADRLGDLLSDLEQRQDIGHVNLVTHSMGGIVARCALHQHGFSKLHRFVMLAPPNTGSHLTRLSLGPLAWCIPALEDLYERPDSLPNLLTMPKSVEVGVIAASRDFIVRVANTVLPQAHQHCTVRASHFEMPVHEGVLSKVMRFLFTGSFYPEFAESSEAQPSRAAA